jgi:hypothetical protein
MGAPRRRFSFQHLKTKHVGIEGNRLIHVAHAHPRVKEFGHFEISHQSTMAVCRFGGGGF